MDAKRTGRSLPQAGSLLLVGVAALSLAYLLAWLLSPGAGVDPSGAAAGRILDPDFVRQAEDYRSQARLIGIASMLLGVSVLAGLAIYRGPRVRRVLSRLAGHPVRGAAIAGAGIALLLALVRIPLNLLAFDLGRDFGLVTQGTAGWAADRLLSTGIAVLLAAAGAALFMWLWRRFRRRFWIAGSMLAVAYAVLFVWLWPVVVSPLFNSFEPLPEGPERSQVIRLADRAGVDVGQVYEVDASRRSSTLNAYVNGIGSSKRVVIYDNAYRQLSDAELSALIAHELSHVKSHDLYRGLAFAVLVVPLGVLFVQIGTRALARARGDDLEGPAIIPALALMISLVTLVLSVPGNVLSRQIEANADRSAIDLTGDPRGLIGLQVKLTETNLGDPDPPALYQYLFGTHPSALERISAAGTPSGKEGR